jgi:hypothetical protein
MSSYDISFKVYILKLFQGPSLIRVTEACGLPFISSPFGFCLSIPRPCLLLAAQTTLSQLAFDQKNNSGFAIYHVFEEFKINKNEQNFFVNYKINIPLNKCQETAKVF